MERKNQWLTIIGKVVLSTTLRLILGKNRIADYDFLENQDFVCVTEKSNAKSVHKMYTPTKVS